jgi:hypothetical protein
MIFEQDIPLLAVPISAHYLLTIELEVRASLQDPRISLIQHRHIRQGSALPSSKAHSTLLAATALYSDEYGKQTLTGTSAG